MTYCHGLALFFFKDFIVFFIDIFCMTVLNIEVLKKIVEKLPDDFEVECEYGEGLVIPVSDNITVNISNKKLLLRFN